MTVPFTAPGLEKDAAQEIAPILQDRLNALIDLSLTLKHVHWNVVGPTFIAVHEMLDPQVEAVRAMADETAERIALLGVPPVGTPGFVVEQRSWKDYDRLRGTVQDHLRDLDAVYVGVLEDHRKAIGRAGELDPVTEDLLIGQVRQLELFQWFVRAHLENAAGDLSG